MSAASIVFLLAASGPAAGAAAADDAKVVHGPSNAEIVVVAERLRAAVNTSAPVEVSLDSGAITGMGASSLADILAQISALTGSSQSRGSDGPILLVNGKRIGSFDEVRNVPPEAVSRVEVLAEEAALRLGYPATAKPVNIVLKPHYRSATGELEDRVTSRGLRNDFNTELNVVTVSGDNRLTLDLQYQTGDAITEAKRGVMRPLDGRAASGGGIVSAATIGQTLPLPLGFAAVPVAGRTLADFSGASPADGTGVVHTLVPKTAQFTAAAALARALDPAHGLSLSARFDRLAADDLQGPGIVDVVVPVGAGNPFAIPVRLRQARPDLSVVRRATQTDTLHLGGQVAGFGRWQWSLAANYDSTIMHRQRTGSLNSDLLQSAIAGFALVDPFSQASAPWVKLGSPSLRASRDEVAGADLFLSGPLWATPAGLVNLAVRGSLSRETIAATIAESRTVLGRTRTGGQASLDVPLLAGQSAVGALDFNANVALDRFSDVGTTHGYGVGLVWKPVRSISVLAALSSDQTPPTMNDLGAPAEVTSDALLFDFETGRSVATARTDGGNPQLRPDDRHIAKLELGWKPLPGLGLTSTYTRLADRSAIMTFPGIAAQVEAALPGHITRDGSGGVIAVDARPFNAAREDRQELRLGLTFSRNFAGTGRSAGPRVPGGGTFGGGHAFGASGSTVQFALSDTVRLSDRIVLSTGSPGLDLVSMNSLADSLRVPRHRIETQVSGTHHGFGLRANAVWAQGGAAGAASAGVLAFSDRFLLNFRLFWFPEKTGQLGLSYPWLHGVRFLLAVDNAFDGYQHVTDRTGVTPLGYQRGILDPLGRTVRFSIRKTLD